MLCFPCNFHLIEDQESVRRSNRTRSDSVLFILFSYIRTVSVYNSNLEVRIADSCGHSQLNNLFRHVYLGMQRGQVVSALDCNPGSPEFRSHKKIIKRKTKAVFILEDILNIWTIIKHFPALGYFQYSRTPVTLTLKGNKKQSELAVVQVIGVYCKIQFSIFVKKSIVTDFSALQCIVQCNLTYFI